MDIERVFVVNSFQKHGLAIVTTGCIWRRETKNVVFGRWYGQAASEGLLVSATLLHRYCWSQFCTQEGYGPVSRHQQHGGVCACGLLFSCVRRGGQGVCKMKMARKCPLVHTHSSSLILYCCCCR